MQNFAKYRVESVIITKHFLARWRVNGMRVAARGIKQIESAGREDEKRARDTRK